VRSRVRRDGEHVIVETEARAFLHNQVRSMVGSLVLVGEGKWEPDDLAAALYLLMRDYEQPQFLNIGAGEDCTIAELAALIAQHPSTTAARLAEERLERWRLSRG